MKTKLILLFQLTFFICNLNALSIESVYEFNANIITYENNNNTVIAEGNAKIYNQKGQKIYSDKIFYNKKTGIIKTSLNTRYEDNIGNKIYADNLIYNTFTNELFSKTKVRITDNNNNKIQLNNLRYNALSKEGYGTNYIAHLNDGSNLRAKKITFNLKNGISKIYDTNYTTCLDKEIKKDFCPSWSLKTSETIHDNNKKSFKHKNAILKIKKLPVLYLPYLEHPDPSVKRKSGLLPPTFKNVTSVGKGIQLPYFYNISSNEDATITPVLYLNQKPLLLGEYRKKFKDSYLILDTSYFQGFKNSDEIGRSSGARNHFYLEYDLNFSGKYFDKNQIFLKIERVSQENYLKDHKINTLLVNEDDKRLENKIQLLSYNEYSGLDLNFKIFENLNNNTSNKYEYNFPFGNYSYNFKKMNNNINFNSNFLSSKIGDEKSSKIINDINTTGQNKIAKSLGTNHLWKTKITNINLHSNNSSNNNSSKNLFTVALENSLPLYKKTNTAEHLISPKMLIKYTSGKMESAESDDKNLFYSDIYSLNRSVDNTNPETGLSLGAGVEYDITKKNNQNNVYLKNSFGIGQVFRTTKLEQMPIKSSLNNKQSSFAGFYNLSFLGKKKMYSDSYKKINNFTRYQQNKFDIKYDFNLNKNLSRLDKNLISLNSVMFNKIITSIDFDEKNKYAGLERKINYGVDFLINKNFSLTSKIIENLRDNLKESETFGLWYENECLQIGLNLKKEFYSNSNLSNNKSLFLSIILKPFGNDINPDISQFVN